MGNIVPHGADLLVLPGQVAVVRELRVELLFEQLVFHLELHALLRMHHGAVEQNVRDQKQRRHDQLHGDILEVRRQKHQRHERGLAEHLRDRKRRKDKQLLAGEVVFRAREQQTEQPQPQCQHRQKRHTVDQRARVCPDRQLVARLKVDHQRRKHQLHQQRDGQLRRDRKHLASGPAAKEQKRHRERAQREHQRAHLPRVGEQQGCRHIHSPDGCGKHRRQPGRKARPVEHAPQKRRPQGDGASVKKQVSHITVISHHMRPPRQDLRRPAHRSARPGRPAAGKTPPWPRPGASG